MEDQLAFVPVGVVVRADRRFRPVALVALYGPVLPVLPIFRNSPSAARAGAAAELPEGWVECATDGCMGPTPLLV
jgi:hypothetical protein